MPRTPIAASCPRPGALFATARPFPRGKATKPRKRSGGAIDPFDPSFDPFSALRPPSGGRGKPVDPFAYGAPEKSCGGGKSLWDASLQRALPYQGGSVLNKGFAPGPVTMEAIEAGTVEQDVPTTRSPALVAYVRAIGLKGGMALKLPGPVQSK